MKLLKRMSLVLLCVCWAGITSAHPLGNFTINHFARLEIHKEKIDVRYVIDMAEIPTFQELQKIKLAGTVSQTELDIYLQRVIGELPAGLVLLIDDRRIPLTVLAKNIKLREGAGGMQTMRIECDFTAVLPESSVNVRHLSFQDNNYEERIGWRELVVLPRSGVSVFDSSAYAGAITDELLTYPVDMLAAPLDERRAELSFTTGEIPAGGRRLHDRQGHLAAATSYDRLTQLIAVPQLTAGVVSLGLLLAAFLGAFHAMSPGHGKAVVAAYLVGSRGTVRHAAFLGLTVTVTHTAGVFALGIATLVASEYVLPERLYPQLSFLSGLLVVGIGLSLLIRRTQAILLAQPHSTAGVHRHHHLHDHPHHHAMPHINEPHSHLPPGADASSVTWRSLLALGISGGLLPCPSALVVLLASISLHRVGYGLLLVVAFSLGLASMLTGVGVLFVYAGRLLKVNRRFDRMARILPLVSALVIATAGAAICYAALEQAGYSISEVFSQLNTHVKS